MMVSTNAGIELSKHHNAHQNNSSMPTLPATSVVARRQMDNAHVPINRVCTQAQPMRAAMPSYVDIVKLGPAAHGSMGNGVKKVAPNMMLENSVPTNAAPVYFQYDNETFQHVSTKDCDYIYCVDDELDLTDSKMLCALENQSFEIHAEKVILPSQLKCKNLVLVCRELVRADLNQPVAIQAKQQWHDVDNLNGDAAHHNGRSGPAGANVSIQVHEAGDSLSWLKINTSGCKGGDGYDNVEAGGVGGNGGDGSNAGDVLVLINSRFAQVEAKLKSAIGLEFDDKVQAVGQLLKELKIDSAAASLAPLIAQVEEANQAFSDTFYDEVAEKQLLASLQVLGQALVMLDAEAVETFKRASVESHGGDYGVYGSGQTAGQNGKQGQDGDVQVHTTGPLADTPKNIESLDSLQQMGMLLQKLMVQYLLVSDLVKKPSLDGHQQADQAISAVVSGFRLLLDRADAAMQTVKSGDSRYKAFKQLADTCKCLLTGVQYGRDYFDNSSNHVPNASCDFYKKVLFGADGQQGYADLFQKIEQQYQSFFDALKEQSIATNALEQSEADAKSLLDNVRLDLASAQKDLNALYQDICFSTHALDGQRESVLSDLKRFETEIKNHFSVNATDLVAALTSCAFCPDNVFQWAVQGGGLLAEGFDAIESATGLKVNKDVELKRIDTFEKDLGELTEKYKQLQDSGIITTDDPDGVKLVAEAQKLDQLLDDFYKVAPDAAEDTKTALTEYVSAVSARNEKILSYNAKINHCYEQQLKAEQLKVKLSEIDTSLRAITDPNMAKNVAFMSMVYQHARSTVMDLIYQLDRSYQFWALDGKSLLSQLADEAPAKIDYATLMSVQSDIVKLYQEAIESYGQNAQPIRKEAPIVFNYPLSETQKNLLCGDAGGSIMIPIPVATASATDDPGSKDYSPFAGKANVRISNVRVFLEGAKTDSGQLHLQIQHSGKDSICNTDNEVHVFEHNAKLLGFVYETDSKKVIEDGEFFESLRPSKDDLYARPGPFTSWTLTIPKSLNKGLDLSQVDSVRMEFAGSSYELPVLETH